MAALRTHGDTDDPALDLSIDYQHFCGFHRFDRPPRLVSWNFLKILASSVRPSAHLTPSIASLNTTLPAFSLKDTLETCRSSASLVTLLIHAAIKC